MKKVTPHQMVLMARTHIAFGPILIGLWVFVTYGMFAYHETCNYWAITPFYMILCWVNWVGIRAIICCRLNKWTIW